MRYISVLIIISTLYACNSSTRTNSDVVESSELANTTPTELEEPELIKSQTELNAEIAVNFINYYVENAHKMREAVEIRDWVKSSELVTENFRTQLVKMITAAFEREPEYGLGFDPILDAQDYPDGKFQLLSFDESIGLAIVNGIEGPGFHIPVILINIDGQTLVDGCGVINIPEELQIVR